MADAGTFRLELATPERQVVQVDALEAQIPCRDGFIGVLPGHAPLVSELRPGVMTYKTATDTCVIAIYGGFVEVSNDHVRVLADGADRKEEIDIEDARKLAEQSQADLAAPNVEADPAAALFEARKAEARLEAALR